MGKIRKKQEKKPLSAQDKRLISKGLSSYPRKNSQKPYKGPEMDRIFDNFKY